MSEFEDLKMSKFEDLKISLNFYLRMIKVTSR